MKEMLKISVFIAATALIGAGCDRKSQAVAEPENPAKAVAGDDKWEPETATECDQNHDHGDHSGHTH